MTETLLTKQEVADQLSIHLRTLEKLINDGDIPIVRIGRAIRIEPADVRSYVDGRKVTAPSPYPRTPAAPRTTPVPAAAPAAEPTVKRGPGRPRKDATVQK